MKLSLWRQLEEISANSTRNCSQRIRVSFSCPHLSRFHCKKIFRMGSCPAKITFILQCNGGIYYLWRKKKGHKRKRNLTIKSDNILLLTLFFRFVYGTYNMEWIPKFLTQKKGSKLWCHQNNCNKLTLPVDVSESWRVQVLDRFTEPSLRDTAIPVVPVEWIDKWLKKYGKKKLCEQKA